MISVGLSLLNIFTVETCCDHSLTTTHGDRFASCEDIISRSQTSSLPPLVFFKHLHQDHLTMVNHSLTMDVRGQVPWSNIIWQ